jgi:hypothetical protein
MFIALDLVLLVLVTLRLTRVVTTDSIGQWWLYKPIAKRAYRGKESRWAKYVEGLQCPFCVGFWIGVAACISLWLVGGPGEAAEWWRWMTGVFALNYITGHIGSRLD